MKINDKELADLSLGPATIEGRLHHKKVKPGNISQGFKERWYKLKSNILFYYNLSETGVVTDAKPVGLFVVENASVLYENMSEAPFCFSMIFHDENDKKHLFSARSEDNVNQWVSMLKQSSYEYWRSQLLVLQSRLSLLTGNDPLFMYPRNEGSKLVPVNRSTQREPSPTPRPRPTKQSSFCSYVEPTFGKSSFRSHVAEDQARLPPPPPTRPPRTRPTPTRPAPPPPASNNLIDL